MLSDDFDSSQIHTAVSGHTYQDRSLMDNLNSKWCLRVFVLLTQSAKTFSFGRKIEY